MDLTPSQTANLADHFVKTIDSVVEFFKDPDNQQAYLKWHREKYGCDPDMEQMNNGFNLGNIQNLHLEYLR